MKKIFTPEHEAVAAEARSNHWDVEVVSDSGLGHLHAILVNGMNQDILEISTAPSIWTAVSTHGTFVFNVVTDELQKWDHTSGVAAEAWAEVLLASTDPLRKWCPELFRTQVEEEVERHIKTAGLEHDIAEQLRDRVAEEVLAWSESEEAAMDAADNFSWEGGGFVLYVHAVHCYDYRYNTDSFWTLEAISWMARELGRRL